MMTRMGRGWVTVLHGLSLLALCQAARCTSSAQGGRGWINSAHLGLRRPILPPSGLWERGQAPCRAVALGQAGASGRACALSPSLGVPSPDPATCELLLLLGKLPH